MQEMDIENDRMIDPDALDIEWLEHSNTFDIYSSHLDDMSKVRNVLKTNLEEQKEEVKRVQADLDLRIRKTPKEFDLEKVTENSISSAILTSPEYQKAQDEYFDIQKNLNVAQDKVNRAHTNVNTMLAKRTALQELNQLMRMQYFATPMEARDLSYEHHQKTKVKKEKVKEKIKKVKKVRSRKQ